MSDVCKDPKGHYFELQPNRDSKCVNCGRTERHDEKTRGWVVIKK